MRGDNSFVFILSVHFKETDESMKVRLGVGESQRGVVDNPKGENA